MEWVVSLVSAVGVGLICFGAGGLWHRFKTIRRATDGDETAKADLKRYRILLTVIAPLSIAAGICLVGIKTYADYNKLRQPLSPDKAWERAMKNLPKPN